MELRRSTAIGFSRGRGGLEHVRSGKGKRESSALIHARKWPMHFGKTEKAREANTRGLSQEYVQKWRKWDNIGGLS